MLYDFSKISEYIDNTDFTSYTFNYPPLAVWLKTKDKGQIKKYWKFSIKRYPQAGLYIHVPFCKTKCSYCRYFSKELSSSNEIDNYLNGLQYEAGIFSPVFKKIDFRTIYIGGGSPSILSHFQLEKLFEIIYCNFHFIGKPQVIFEANPQFLDLEKIKILAKYKVNRLTIGVQTLNSRVLKKINRTQSVKSVFRCYKQARKVGIEFINIDLMCGLPSQTMHSFVRDLGSIVQLRPDIIHISRFSPTSFVMFSKAGNKLSEIELNRASIMENFVGQFLPRIGYRILEYDAWGLDEHAQNLQLTESKRDYSSFLGLGPGAVSRASGYFRYVNTPNLKDYQKILSKNRLPIYLGYKVNKKECMRDFILSNLWYGKLSNKKFLEVFGESLEKHFGVILKRLLYQGWLNYSQGCYLTKRKPPDKDCLLFLQKSFYNCTHLKKINTFI